jgi:hypothetical protein
MMGTEIAAILPGSGCSTATGGNSAPTAPRALPAQQAGS